MSAAKLFRAAIGALCLACIQPAFASSADYVHMPGVEQGERELDVKYGAAGNGTQASSVGLGYGVTESWFTEVYLSQEHIGPQNQNLVEWENKFQLTETGKYPVDVGFLSELEAPLGGQAPWELRLGPLLQTEFGKIQVNGNMLFVRAFGVGDETGIPFATNLAYEWQVKYRWKPTFEFGVQGLGEVGRWDNWSRQAEQLHRIGPAAFGKIALGNRQAIKYNIAWLMGVSTAAPNHTLRTQVEYEF